MGNCCARAPSTAEPQESYESELKVTLNVLLKLLDLLQAHIQSQSPYIEILILYFSKIHSNIHKEFIESANQQAVGKNSKTVKGFSSFRHHLQVLSKDLELILSGDKINAEIEAIKVKIGLTGTLFKEISSKSITIFFPVYQELNLGLSTSNFSTGFDKIAAHFFNETLSVKELEGYETFKSLIAAQFWLKNFKNKEFVEFEEFKGKLGIFSEQMNKQTLNDGDWEKIEKEVCEMEKNVNKAKWEEFYVKRFMIWNSRKNFLGN